MDGRPVDEGESWSEEDGELDLGEILDLDGVDTYEQIDARRAELMDAMGSLMDEREVIKGETARAYQSFREGRGGKPYSWRLKRNERLDKIKTDLFELNRAMALLKARSKALTIAQNPRGQSTLSSKIACARVTMQLVAILEEQMPDEVDDLWSHAVARDAEKVPIRSRLISRFFAGSVQEAEQSKKE